jgi:hypothetical protein
VKLSKLIENMRGEFEANDPEFHPSALKVYDRMMELSIEELAR